MIVYNTDTDKVENLVILGKNGNQPIIVNLNYMQDTTPSNPQEKEIWYNTSNNKIYTYKNNQWKETGEATVGVWYEYNNEYYLWDGNSLEKTDLNIYEKIQNKTDNPNETSTIKYPSSKALKDGLDATFPKIITDSGSSLPSVSGYQEGDTFLNTTDKKIYKAEEEIVDYTLATGVINSNWQSSNVSIDLNTGVASGFKSGSSYNYFLKTNVNKRWNGVQEYNVHFKITVNPSSSTLYNIFVLRNQTSFNNATNVAIGIKDNKLQIQCFSSYSSTGSGTYSQIVAPKEILDFTLEQNIEYFLTIKKKDSIGTIETSISTTNYTENILATQITETGIGDVSTSYSSNCDFVYGQIPKYNSSSDTTLYNYGYSFTIGQVYLGDSSGEFVIANTGLSWDSGISLIDKTEVVDKTNGILYLYENSELVKVPKPSNLSFTNISASNWVSDNTYADYAYKCDLSCSGVTANMFAQVIFAPTEADSGNYATICNTGIDIVTIYSKVNDTITIPSIVVMGV